jgi:uncharacterized protein (TIGR03437 family)
MLQWLESDLQRTRQTWKVLFFHHPPYATGNHEGDINGDLVRRRVAPIVDRYGVDLVLSGHEHSYQRTFPLAAGRPLDPGLGTVYLVSGGGGAPLYPVLPRPFLEFGDAFYNYLRAEVDGARMTITAIEPDGSQDGRVRDRFTIEPRIPLTGDPPKLSTEGIVNAASFTAVNPGVAPGAIVSLFGQNLALRERQVSSPLPLPTQLIGTTVTVNGRLLPLFYVSPGQINAQLLYGMQGRVTLQVSTPIGTTTDVPLTILDTAPGIFTLSPDPAVVHQNGTLVSSASPAQASETISIFLTGLGEVNGTASAGDAAPSSPLLTATAPVLVQIGAQTIPPSFAGLTPSFAGLYQVNVQIPAGLASGRQPMRVLARGIGSNEVNLSVR